MEGFFYLKIFCPANQIFKLLIYNVLKDHL